MTKIRFIIGDEVLTATLDENAAANDFARMLPLELSLSDYHGIEKVADLGHKLDDTGMPRAYEPRVRVPCRASARQKCHFACAYITHFRWKDWGHIGRTGERFTAPNLAGAIFVGSYSHRLGESRRGGKGKCERGGKYAFHNRSSPLVRGGQGAGGRKNPDHVIKG